MTTRNLVIGLLILAGLAFLLINPTPIVMNQRINPAASTDSTTFTSTLESMTADEKLTERLSEIQSTNQKDPFDATSRAVQEGDSITVHYRGWLAKDQTVFDASFNRNQPFTFTVGGNVIKGWNLGVIGMRVGEIKRLKIPASLGYGAEGNGDAIPGDSDLIFDIELVKIN